MLKVWKPPFQEHAAVPKWKIWKIKIWKNRPWKLCKKTHQRQAATRAFLPQSQFTFYDAEARRHPHSSGHGSAVATPNRGESGRIVAAAAMLRDDSMRTTEWQVTTRRSSSPSSAPRQTKRSESCVHRWPCRLSWAEGADSMPCPWNLVGKEPTAARHSAGRLNSSDPQFEIYLRLASIGVVAVSTRAVLELLTSARGIDF
jgi:hypothetical protein